MASLAPTVRTTKRGLLVRDSLVFFALCGVTAALFVITLFLFRSFENHRDDLGKRWAERGETALHQGHATEAVAALRTALSYHDDLQHQLLLAQALAQAGRTEEARNYFLTLRETRPGDGFINLQLARLTREQGDAQEAIDYYRASIFGTWQGDGTVRRREVRLELAGYLAQRGNTQSARDELLIAAGNAPESVENDLLFADRLQAIGDVGDALTFYKKALAASPHRREALVGAGRSAYALHDYAQASKWLTAALAEHGGHSAAEEQETREITTLAANARRVPELTLSRDLLATERAEHLLAAAHIAQARLQGCLAAKATPAPATPGASSSVNTPVDPALQGLKTRWAQAASQLNKRALQRDATLEDSTAQLINDTEQQTVAPCGAPTGDDALLLMLANSARGAGH